MDDTLLARANRSPSAAVRLSNALEPFVGSVYFSPECHENYARLGFSASKSKAGAVQLPDGPAYFTSRGSVMGQVPGEVVAAAFGVFNPDAVIPAVDFGWSLTDAATISEARRSGAIAQLRRLLGDHPAGLDTVVATLRRAVSVLRPEGRPLFAGLCSQDEPDDALGLAWWLGDQLREFRGDAHTAAWISEGLDAIEIGLLTELWWGLPLHSYVRTRAWTEAQVNEAIAGLEARSLLADRKFTDQGRNLRQRIEERTDAQMAPALRAIGDDLEPTIAQLSSWSALVRSGHGYLAAGPQSLTR